VKGRGWIAVLVLVALALPGGVAFAAGSGQDDVGDGDDWIVVGDDATVAEGQTVAGNVVVVGGDLCVEEGGQVGGDVLAVGQSLDVAGRVSGDVVAIGAALRVRETAHIGGETVAVGGEVDTSDDATLLGDLIVTPGPDLTDLRLPPIPRNLPAFGRPASVPASRVLNRLVAAFSNALILGVLAGLVLLIWPEPLTRIERAITQAPAAVGGVGCLSVLLFPLLSVVLVVTLILSPLVFLLSLAFLAALLFGWVAMGTLFGERLLAWFGRNEITPRVAGIVGTFALTLLVSVIGALPGFGFLGLVSGWTLAMVGVGAVVLTRFGRRAYASVPAAHADARLTVPPEASPSPGEPAEDPPASK